MPRLILSLAFLAAWLGMPFAAGAGDAALTFKQEIQPLLAVKCGKCHAEDVRKGDLDLSSLSALARGGESGEPLVADSPEESLLWNVLEDERMPPDDEPGLTPQETMLLRSWIEATAASQQMQAADDQPLTQHDVLPILLLRCTVCHGPRLQRGGLDLRDPTSMLAGGEHGPALIPGDPDGSLMVQRVESEACPPGDQLLKYFVRRPTYFEIEIIRKWIAQGAPVVDVEPDVATNEPDPLVSDTDRQHWAFRSPRRDLPLHSIDAYIERQLTEHQLSWSPEAPRESLIRRVYLDLIGVPPSRRELRRWRDSESPRWYTSMVDQLLASPRYGERWGRYWLDLAGYADSEGGISADPLRPVAWKYRDYVIKAFNEDKPYDRFLLEQLAGDELVDVENAATIADPMVDNLVATGFLRMGIDETGSRTMNFVPERLKVISDAISIVSSGLMGMTMECARCHSHKYDPIPHRDYYRFKAIFQGALDEHDWDSFKTRSLQLATARHRRRIQETNPPLESQIKQLTSERKRLETEIRLDVLRHHYPQQHESDHQATIAALKKADNNRTLPQKILVERLQVAELRPDEEQPDSVLRKRRQSARLQQQIDWIRARQVPSTQIRALWDQGRPSPTYLLHRGEHDKPGRLVGPGVPSVLTDGKTPFEVEPPFPGGTPKTGRRLAFARWLVEPTHPLTARVMVNRIWQHHFGKGLVATADNFGVAGERPSHPELLDWLAVEFTERGWSVKQMHRLIINSRVYRQSSRTTAEHDRVDPENRFLARMPLRRMNAEALRDSLLLVAGKLEETPGGRPDTVTVSRDGMVSANTTTGGGWRRSVYLQYRRTEIPTMMDTFDYPQMGPNCLSRNVSTVSPQSLMLMNNQQVRSLAGATASRIFHAVTDGDHRYNPTSGGPHANSSPPRGEPPRTEDLIRVAYEVILSRSPSKRERELGVAVLNQLRREWEGDAGKALETYCHTLLNSAAFLYID